MTSSLLAKWLYYFVQDCVVRLICLEGYCSGSGSSFLFGNEIAHIAIQYIHTREGLCYFLMILEHLIRFISTLIRKVLCDDLSISL